MRSPENIVAEIQALKFAHGVTRIRFVDDLFLASKKIMHKTLSAFVSANLKVQWDATGRINILATSPPHLIDLMLQAGCREVALGIESGSDRVLAHIKKRITVEQVVAAVTRLCQAGISVKGYFILGLPSETKEEQGQTLYLIEQLWNLTANLPGSFRCSVFEYRPYPGTPEWQRLISTGLSAESMIHYESESLIGLDDGGMLDDCDEFNFSTGIQFGEVPVSETRRNVVRMMKRQRER